MRNVTFRCGAQRARRPSQYCLVRRSLLHLFIAVASVLKMLIRLTNFVAVVEAGSFSRGAAYR